MKYTLRIATLWPRAALRARSLRTPRAAILGTKIVLATGLVFALWAVVNGAYQVVRKPAELFFPVSGALAKTPSETWRQYAPIFRAHSTEVITPAFLAALAQVEGAGNPMARTYWRWSLSWDPFEVYRPASSAVGMYQITNGTFTEAKRYCIHDHAVVEDGPWYDWRSCWFNALYLRVVPSHAVEMTSALLHRQVAKAVTRRRVAATVQQKQDLAAMIHLCGAGAGHAYIKRGFRITAGQRCGAHDLGRYLAKVNAMKSLFASLNEAEQ